MDDGGKGKKVLEVDDNGNDAVSPKYGGWDVDQQKGDRPSDHSDSNRGFDNDGLGRGKDNKGPKSSMRRTVKNFLSQRISEEGEIKGETRGGTMDRLSKRLSRLRLHLGRGSTNKRLERKTQRPRITEEHYTNPRTLEERN